MSGTEQYQVTIVKYGTRTAMRSEVFLNYPLYHEPDEAIGMDYFFWIVRSAERTVVVDTGFSPAGGRSRNRTTLAEMPALLRAFGVDPELAPPVVLTHAHYDHAGNLDVFPYSRVTVAERELAFWSGPHAHRTLFHHAVDDADLDHLATVREEGRLDAFSGTVTIAPGIEIIELGGHTPGQSVVKVETSAGTVLLASDAIHYYEEYERGMLFTSVTDLVEMYDAFDTIREMVGSGKVDHLVSGHDPDTLSRFTPADGEFGHLAATIGELWVSGRFDGQVAVVTGAASGLGRASATRLAADGAHVVGVDLDRSALETLVGSLDTPSVAVVGDIADESTVDAYTAVGRDTFGRIDHYHLNAGIFGTFAPLPELEIADFDRVMAVNLRGQFLGLRAAFRQYAAQGTTGSICVTASIASLTGSADLFAYHTSKHGVVGLVHGAAVYGGPLGIRVNGVAPGIVPTELFAAAPGATGGKNDMERRAGTTPLRRAGTPEEIAGVVAFLLSEDSSYITGQIVSADGGATIVNSVRPSGGAGAWDTGAVDRAIYGPTFGGANR